MKTFTTEAYVNPPMKAMISHTKGTPYRSKSYRAYMAYLQWRFGGAAQVASLALYTFVHKKQEADIAFGYPVSPERAYAAYVRETPKYDRKLRYVVPAKPELYEDTQKRMVAAIELVMQKEDEAHAQTVNK